MKLRIYFFLPFLFIGCNSYKFIDTTYFNDDFDGYKSMPKIVETKRYKYVKKDSVYEMVASTTRQRKYYDKRGRVVADSSLKADGSFIKRSNVIYSKNGRIQLSTNHNSDGSIYNKEYFSYTKNYLTSIEWRHSTEHFFYDEKGNKIRTVEVSKKESNPDKIVRLFNDQNQETETNYYYKGKLKSIAKLYYDKNGNKVKRENIDSSGNLKSYNLSKYDHLNNNIEIRSFKIKEGDTILNRVLSFEYIYDDKGNYLKMTMFRDEIPLSSYAYKYVYW